MAKKQTKTENEDLKASAQAEESTALTVVGGANLPAHLIQRMEQDAGKGTSQAAEDNIVPIIKVLQALSPQLNKQNQAEFIEGAEAGDVFLKNTEDPIVKGSEGFVFQPCYFFRKVVEWVPRKKGGGFVAHHDQMPDDVEQREDDQGKKRWVRKSNGNECIDTRYHVGHLIKADGTMLAFVIPMSSSGHQVSRTWHTLMNSVRLPNGEIPPSFARLYRLKTVMRTKNNDSWFTFDVSSHGWSTEAQYERGLKLHEDFAKGEKVVGDEQEDGSTTAEKAPF